MRDLTDCVLLLVIAAVMALIVAVVIGDIEKAERQEALHSECISTDYDKFQCYSMIYGDK